MADFVEAASALNPKLATDFANKQILALDHAHHPARENAVAHGACTGATAQSHKGTGCAVVGDPPGKLGILGLEQCSQVLDGEFCLQVGQVTLRDAGRGRQLTSVIV